MHCRMFNSIPGPYKLYASSMPPVVTTKMSPDIAKCRLRDKSAFHLGTTALTDAHLIMRFPILTVDKRYYS